MIEVGILTEEQKDLLVGQEFMVDVYFNPIQDANNNWIISSEEIDQSEDKEIISFKDLRLNVHQAKIDLTDEPTKDEPPKNPTPPKK